MAILLLKKAVWKSLQTIATALNNDYARHLNPEIDYSFIDTITKDKVNYSISEEEASDPFPETLA